ncbi:DUF4199 domain-containing protein [Salegentibacter chungangensis]|uniref:DUF4199 domain-containing protein n=1 Tax=Salegentibacter chungangensis TaxID=1335724 RepID=A0ABW3NPX1_9FLAO
MENSPSVKSVAYPYGLMLAIYSILVLVLIYLMNIDQENWVIGTVNSLVTIVLYILALRTFKKKNGGFMKLKEALKVGLAIAAISGIISAVYAYIHYSFVYPEFLDMMYEKSYLDITERNMPQAQTDQALELSKMTLSPLFFATTTLILNLFFGFLISLIVGLIMKRENPAYQ